MVLFEDALKSVLSQTFHIDSEHVALSDSSGRILAGDIVSDMDMPPFDKSAVDGYACRMQDLLQPTDALSPGGTQNILPLRLIETIPAGQIPEKNILPGECSKIMTGAMIPVGADCVVMVEDTYLVGENLVGVIHAGKGSNICYRGEDIMTGNLVLPKGLQIKPAHVAVLASVGVVNPLVTRLPRVAIISTGDELVEPQTKPGTAQIRNSNACQLEAQVRSVPAMPFYLGIAQDEGPELRKKIDLAFAGNDLVLLTGGVSMGDFDFVPEVMQQAGVEILFKSLAIQPGKPTVFGRKGNTFIFGLPGNPVSSFVIFEMMVKPFLHAMMGSSVDPLNFKLPLGVDFSRRRGDRKSMIPVSIRNGTIYPVEYHGSAHINAYTIADGIMSVEIGTIHLNKGEEVNVRPL
jgi:molybdopterin molybdotransferase